MGSKATLPQGSLRLLLHLHVAGLHTFFVAPSHTGGCCLYTYTRLRFFIIRGPKARGIELVMRHGTPGRGVWYATYPRGNNRVGGLN